MAKKKEVEQPNECEVCGKDCKILTAKGCFKENKDDRMMCDACYKETHNELP